MRVRSSIISSGTDRALIEGSGSGSLVKKVGQNPGLFGKVYDVVAGQGFSAARSAVLDKLHERIALGYSCAGEVVACGADTQGFNVGDRVACAGVGHACHAEVVTVPSNLSVILPPDVDFDCGAFVALGAIAQHGIRQAQVSYGENVLVIGLGLIGQLVLQEAKASGLHVVGADLARERLDMARLNGADLAVNLDEEQNENVLLQWTSGIGFDAVVITASDASSSAFEAAGRLVRDRGTISLVGVVGLPSASTFFLGKEITVRGARSYGPGRYDARYEERGIDYPLNYVRWTENRIMALFIKNASSRKPQLERLISNRFSVSEAPEAYRLVEEAEPTLFAVALNYPGPSVPINSKPYQLNLRSSAIGSKYKIGVWGVGAFAREAHLPNLLKHRHVELVAIGSSSGSNAAEAARRYNARQSFTDFGSMIESGIDGLIITSRHNEHTTQAIRALNMGISVLVEKPLAINREDLLALGREWERSAAGLLAGHNRKYSPVIQRIKEEATERCLPMNIIYRIAPGPMKHDHWMCDIDIGGGRLVSELSHFVDTCLAIVAAPVVQASAVYVNGDKTALQGTLLFSGGSSAQISYLPEADKAIGKEYLEVHFGGRSLRMLDFKTLNEGKDNVLIRHRHPDKGYGDELHKFLSVIEEPRSEQHIKLTNHDLAATRITFDLIASAEAGGVMIKDGC